MLEDIPEGHKQLQPSNFDRDSQVALKVLGLQWDAATFCRKLLGSMILWDSYLLSRFWLNILYSCSGKPVLTGIKIPTPISQLWNHLKEQLSTLSSVKIPRHVPLVVTADCQLHGFCDASVRGYGCVIYLRTITQGVPTVRLLTTKSKVAELCVVWSSTAGQID